MLVSFSFGNYKSFKDENNLSLVADMTDTDQFYSVASPFEYSVLKTVAVYGANASGKSKLFEAIDFMQVINSFPNKFQILKKIFLLSIFPIIAKFKSSPMSVFENTSFVYLLASFIKL